MQALDLFDDKSSQYYNDITTPADRIKSFNLTNKYCYYYIRLNCY